MDAPARRTSRWRVAGGSFLGGTLGGLLGGLASFAWIPDEVAPGPPRDIVSSLLEGLFGSIFLLLQGIVIVAIGCLLGAIAGSILGSLLAAQPRTTAPSVPGSPAEHASSRKGTWLVISTALFFVAAELLGPGPADRGILIPWTLIGIFSAVQLFSQRPPVAAGGSTSEEKPEADS